MHQASLNCLTSGRHSLSLDQPLRAWEASGKTPRVMATGPSGFPGVLEKTSPAGELSLPLSRVVPPVLLNSFLSRPRIQIVPEDFFTLMISSSPSKKKDIFFKGQNLPATALWALSQAVETAKTHVAGCRGPHSASEGDTECHRAGGCWPGCEGGEKDVEPQTRCLALGQRENVRILGPKGRTSN